MEKLGYVAKVTEYERNWGSRPDGFIICQDLEVGKAFATKDNGHVYDYNSGEEFSTAGDFHKCNLTDACISALQEKEEAVMWVGDSSFKRFIEEVYPDNTWS